MVFVGCGLGGVLRYFISSTINPLAERMFPFGTLTVNVTGSFLMGMLFVILVNKANILSMELQTFLLVGFLGGYTTFSSFSIETLNLFEQSKFILAFSNIGANVLLCILASLVGIILGRQI